MSACHLAALHGIAGTGAKLGEIWGLQCCTGNCSAPISTKSSARSGREPMSLFLLVVSFARACIATNVPGTSPQSSLTSMSATEIWWPQRGKFLTKSRWWKEMLALALFTTRELQLQHTALKTTVWKTTFVSICTPLRAKRQD